MRYPLILLACLVITAPEGFSQPRTLDDYILSARRYNASFIDYQNQLASLTYDSSKIRATFLPKVNVTGQANISPVIGGYGYDSAISNGANYSALIGVTQDLFQGGNRDLQLAKLGAQRESLYTTLAINIRDLIKNISSQYVTAYSDLRAMESAEESFRIIEEQLSILEELVKRGVYLQVDYMNPLISRNQQQIAALQARTQYRTDLYKLNQLSGIVDSTTVTLTAPQLTAGPTIPLYNSLKARQFAFDSLAIEYERSLLDWTYRPKLSWAADAGLNTTDLRNAYHNIGFSVTLNFAYPLYDGRQKYFESEKFNLSLNTIAAKQRAFYIETSTQKMMLEEQLRGEDSLITQYQKQLESINELLQFDRVQLKQGNLKINDLLTVLNTLNTNRLSLRQAEISRLQTIVELNNLNQ
jgi:outer membrane protein TolC